MLKQILFVALLAFALAKVHKTDDAFFACLKSKCKNQFFTCQSDVQCMSTINRCTGPQSNTDDKKSVLTCLQQNNNAWALLQCAHSSCGSGRAEEIILKGLK